MSLSAFTFAAALLLGAAPASSAEEMSRVTYYVKHRPEHTGTLLRRFHEVSDPRHARYGQHLSLEEVQALQSPQAQHVAAVRSHIRAAGGVEIAATAAQDKIIAMVPASEALALSKQGGPLWDAIDTVSGLSRTPAAAARVRQESSQRQARRERRAHLRASSPAGHNNDDTSEDPQKCLADRAVPPCIRKAYGIEDEVSTSTQNSQAVIVNQGYKMQDLKAFCSEYGLKHCPTAVTDVGKNDGEAGDEATLDVQYSVATGQGVPETWVYINGHTANPFSNWITWASNTSSIPWVHSLSVGEPEGEFASDNGGQGAVDRMNNEMAAIGARGVSIIFASGDSGYQPNQKYPSSSPYVTSVGGVFNGELGDDVLQVDDETTGGFSSLEVNPIGKWQVEAVAAWEKTKGARPKYNASRRACPDLSIYDAGFYTVQDGSDQPIGGTSAAAPTLAGMISSINGHLLDAGKPTLGFLNYFLYQHEDAFLDIVHGGNNGFDATVGYDPASGLGTFSPTTFATLKAAALAKNPQKEEEEDNNGHDGAGTCCEPQQYKCCKSDADCCTNWGKLQCSVGVCVFPGNAATVDAGSEAVDAEVSATASLSPTLLVGLRHSQAARQRLDDLFWAVADPAKPAYTQLDGPTDITSLSLADATDLEAAKAWLKSIGADMSTLEIVPAGDAVEVSWPQGKGAVQAPKPPQCADYVVLKGATNNHLTSDLFKSSRQSAQERAKRSADDGSKSKEDLISAAASIATERRRLDDSFGPAAQKKAYNVPADLKGTNKANTQMVFGTGTFGYRKEDIDMFFSTYATSSSTEDVSFDTSNKWTGKTGKNFVEGELDVSYIAAFAPGVRTLVANPNISAATESGEGFGAALLAFLVELNSRDTVPNVLSMSLGSLSFGSCDKMCTALASKGGHTYKACWSYLQTQFQACMFDSAAVEQRIDAELAKLGLRGTTITAASGDGASHFAFGPFSGDIGSDLNGIICGQMNMPVYPTASPYVLSVGGTQWSSDDIYGPECSADKPCGWTDGGAGFAWKHAQPSFQNNVTAEYLKEARKVAPKTMVPATTFNASGRGYPDVAALAQFGIPLCDYGGCSGSGGTSASAPTVAGMLSLINDARLNAGLKSLGYINTKLYGLMADAGAYAECFTDIGIKKLGDEWDCQTYSSCDGCDDGGGSGPGFVATEGWDAQTGFGQPNFAGWLKYLGKD